MKNIKLTQSQIKALENSATMLIFSCEHNIIASDKERTVFKVGEWEHDQPTDLYIKDFAPIQKGDKYVCVKEEWDIWDDFRGVEHFRYKSDVVDIENFDFEPASEMTKEQSRYSIDCLDGKLVKVQDINAIERYKISQIRFQLDLEGKMSFTNFYNQQMQEQSIDRTYKDNDYVFLAEVKFNKDKK